MAKAKRMVIVGIDSISIDVLDQMIARGYCPTLKQLIANGCYAHGRSFCPVETGTNWAVLSTGASPMITGCNMSMHLPGKPLNWSTRGFPSELCKAEQIWNAARRGGKRSIIFDYPQSWPVNCEGAIHIGEDGRPGRAIRALSENCGWKTAGPYRGEGKNPNVFVHKIAPTPAASAGWANLPADIARAALSVELPIIPANDASEYDWVKPIHALLLPSSSSSSLAFFARKDFAAKMGEVRVGEWSAPLIGDFETNKGAVRAWTQMKCFALSPDGADIHLYAHEIYPLRGFVHPAALEDQLLELCGPYYPHTCRQQSVNSGACDVWTFLEEVKRTVDWYCKALTRIAQTEEWDLFIQKWHPPDFAYHFGAFMIDERHPLYDPARHEEGWNFWGEVMRAGDRIVRTAMELAGPDTIVAVMSDHGGKMVYPGSGGHASYASVLERAGLIARTAGGGVDWAKTRAWAGEHYVWVNLKGRDPDGIVAPGEEYERVRQQAIDALLDARDPHSGRHVANIACRIEDASMVGIGGDRVGDVFIWAEEGPAPPKLTRAEFERLHPGVELGTWEWPRHNSGSHKPNPFMIMCGPGFRRGYRKALPVWVNTFAPTLAHAWGIPTPKNADGAVIWDFVG